MTPTVDIVIPSFNGKYLLEKHLPQIIETSDYLNKIIIIDNGSTDGTVDWLHQHYPNILVIENKKNLGFTKPVNQGVSRSDAEFVVLMNNDVRPAKNYLKKTLHYFTNPKLFAVSFNEKDSSWPEVTWSHGKLQFTRGEDKSVARYSAWASGGSAIFRRSIWNKIGGLNEVYAPYYWEDIDICYRSWKMGYEVIWDSESLVFHEHESTAKKINPAYINLIRQRNELLFNWINITDSSFRLGHLQFLIMHSIKHPRYLRVIVAAVFRLLSNRQRHQYLRSDKEILSIVNKKYEQT